MVSQGLPNIIRVFTINVKEEGREGGNKGRRKVKDKNKNKSTVEETKAMHKENIF